MATLDKADLQFILDQIRMAEAGQPPVNPHLPFGLRQVAGTSNNAVAGQGTFGSVDQVFPRIGPTYFQTVTVNVDDTVFDPHPGQAGDTITTSYDQTAVSRSPDPATAGIVIDTAPRIISNLIADQSANNPAALDAAKAFAAQLGDGYGIIPANPDIGSDGTYYGDAQNLFIGNIVPDAGLSAPFNTWMTLFGQFFDHGLDLVAKGGSGTVFIPLQLDDPLYVPGAQTNFMVLTRATNLAGADGVLGTADDIHDNINTVTPFIDQNQTYSSHPSHQVFLRDYLFGSDGRLHSTGRLLSHQTTGAGTASDTSDDRFGEANWKDVKENAASKLGILLSDRDVADVPLVATDEYGNLKLDAQGRVQIIVDVVKTIGGVSTLIENQIVKATPGGTPVDIHALTIGQVANFTIEGSATYTVTVAHTGHAFLNDIAHGADPNAANPLFNRTLPEDAVTNSRFVVADADSAAGGAPPAAGTYDNELLDAHIIAGDGRANENIGLTAVHEVFHSEHNRQGELIKTLIRTQLANGDTAFASDWVLPGANLYDGIQDNEWNGERIFQAAKFATETQYQHLVFEEFARKIAPTIHLFGNVDINLDPAISAEFAHAVYRFGHSMLDETLPRYQIDPATGTAVLGPDGQPVLSEDGLIQAFLNPLEFAALGPDAAGQVALGTISQVGNEIDEFVTGALRNNLLGLPLDLAALNIARGRDTGVAPLNVLRNQLYDSTHDTNLKPYASWDEFGQFLKHPLSLVNFVAAYGTHASITSAATVLEKRSAALALVQLGEDVTSKDAAIGTAARDAYDFMHSLGAYANNASHPLAVHTTWSTGSVTGLDTVDLWIGGLAEKQILFGGLLGSTFNFIFEMQLNHLQDGDRLYYLPRIEGLHWGSEIEGNAFAVMIQNNLGVAHLPASIFLTPEYHVEAAAVTDDPSTWMKNPVTGQYVVEKLTDAAVHSLVDVHPGIHFGSGFDTQVRFIGDDNFFGNTMVLGGTEGRDVLIAGQADDDTVWGDGGNDYIDGGNGNDFLYGGKGDDTISDTAGNDNIHGEEGNDTIQSGIGDDIVFGGDGNDSVDGGTGIDVISGGRGNDVLVGGEGDDEITGNEGDDWIAGGDGGDLLIGDQGAPTGMKPLVTGNDVIDGGASGDRMQAFSGDDIMFGLGGFDRFEGGDGYDWADFEQEVRGVSTDMRFRAFIADPLVPGADAIRDVYAATEAVSGSAYDDVLLGDDPVGFNFNQPIADIFNQLQNVDLILGLSDYFPESYPADAPPLPVAYSNGNIMLGGGGDDRIMGRGGNDIIDGDAHLHVALIDNPDGSVSILREILHDKAPGNIDTALYQDLSFNYQIMLKTDADGNPVMSSDGVTPVLIIQHIRPVIGNGGLVQAPVGLGNFVNEGTDTLYNIERLEFFDVTIDNPFLTGDFNRAPQGTVLINGDTNLAAAGVDPWVGFPLTADTLGGALYDPDSISSALRYQWQYLDPIKARWVDIVGATSQSFSPTGFFNTYQLRVQVSYTDGLGYDESLHSAPTNPVTLPPAINTAPFVVQQQGTIGFLDTTAREHDTINHYLSLTTAFNDRQTAPANMGYSAALIDANGVSHALDGSVAADNLLFTVLRNVSGGVTGGVITGQLPVGVTGPQHIRVTATDNWPGAPLTASTDFNINVLPVAPSKLTIVSSNSADIQENTVGSVSVLTANPRSANVTFSLAGTDARYFEIKSSSASGFTFSLKAPQDFESPQHPDNAFHLQIRAFDGITTALQTMTVNITNVVGSVISGTDSGDAMDAVTGSVSAGMVVDGFAAAAGAPGATGEEDIISGGAGADTLVGLGGNDQFTYVAGQGADSIDGGAGSDTLTISGTSLSDSLSAIYDGARISSLAGGKLANIENVVLDLTQSRNDWLSYKGSSASVSVELGANAASGFTSISGVENVVGGNGSDTLISDAVSNVIYGNGGNDLLQGGLGKDTIYGGAGNDTIRFESADAASAAGLYDGGTGNDKIAMAGVSLSLVALYDAQINDIEVVDATAVTLSVAIDLSMQTERFTVLASAGADTISGGAGADLIRAGLGDDLIVDVTGADTIAGGGGFDTISLTKSSADLNAMQNGSLAAVEAVSAATATTSVVIDLTQQTEAFQVTGSAFADRILLSQGADTISGGAGPDTIDGGQGVDVVSYASSSAAVAVNLASAAPQAGGDAAGDVLRFVENLTGSAYNDTLTGNGGRNSLDGQGGDDTIAGGAGTDLLIGGSGHDRLNGGTGADTLVGGIGNDTFVFRAGLGADRIDDFEVGTSLNHDTLDLRGLGFASLAAVLAVTDAGPNALIHIGADTILLAGVDKTLLNDFNVAI